MPKQDVRKKQLELASQILLDVKPDTPSYYVNYIGVSHTAYDFTLNVCRIPSPLLPAQLENAKSGKPIPLEPLLQIVVAPLLVDGLIKALIDQKGKYAVTLAQQEKNNAIQHQHARPLRSVQ